jgi:hypothetical protein
MTRAVIPQLRSKPTELTQHTDESNEKESNIRQLEQIVEIIGVQYRFLDFLDFWFPQLLHISHPCACHGPVKGKFLLCPWWLIEDGTYFC